LWALKVGNGAAGGDANTVYFTAGLFGETHGLFGSLKPVAKGTPEGPAEEQMVQAALDVVQLDLTQLQQDIASGAPRSTIVQDIRTLNADVVQFVRSEIQFARDESRDGGASSKASAERALETVFAELGSLKLDLD